MYKNALRKGYTFNYKGVCTLQDLFDLSLTELDMIYKNLMAELVKTKGESLLQIVSKETTVIEDKIAIIKDIVATKLEEQEIAKAELLAKAEKQKIMYAISKKKESKYDELSVEELENLLKDI